MERVKRTYNPCDDCEYSYSKNNQESNMCKICEFKTYFDADRQGKLIILPCKVGDVVYIINEDAEDIYLPSTRYYFIDECKFIVEMYNDIGKTVFLTKEEAEQALAKMKEM